MFSLIPMHFLSPDVTIQMQYSVVTVNEYSNRVTVCTTMSGTSDIYNAVRLSTISDTAGIYNALNTVEPPNNGHVRAKIFVLYREVVLFQEVERKLNGLKVLP